jgi:hypothetical protein
VAVAFAAPHPGTPAVKPDGGRPIRPNVASWRFNQLQLMVSTPSPPPTTLPQAPQVERADSRDLPGHATPPPPSAGAARP